MQFDRVVSQMMKKYGGSATINVVTGAQYDPTTSENIVTTVDYPVRAMFFDYVRKNEGVGTENNTLIKTGDKQVFIQPTHKADPLAAPIPQIDPSKDKLTIGNTQYKIITVKQVNANMTDEGCILYELFVRV